MPIRASETERQEDLSRFRLRSWIRVHLRTDEHRGGLRRARRRGELLGLQFQEVIPIAEVPELLGVVELERVPLEAQQLDRGLVLARAEAGFLPRDGGAHYVRGGPRRA